MIDLSPLKTVASRHLNDASAMLPRLSFSSFNHPTDPGPLMYEPLVCLVLQGSKRVFFGADIFDYGPGNCMVVAAELVGMGQIVQATPDRPYLAINLHLDPAVISSLLLEAEDIPGHTADSGFVVAESSPALLDAWSRYVDLLDQPSEISVMAPHREHELMFRLLMSPQGNILRQIGRSESRLSHIRRAMAWIRNNFADHLSVDAMATIAGMSVTVFHRRFKAVTGLSPLQYQKQVRLHEARRRLMAEHIEAATVGYAVGYESASQFSREYKRLFGAPPKRDTESLGTVHVPL